MSDEEALDKLARLAGFARLRFERELTLRLDAATMKRIRAHVDRVERDEPGLGWDPAESEEDSLLMAVGALLDRGLAESEADDGLVASPLTGDLVAHHRVAAGLRIRRAGRVLRRGW